MKATKDDSRTPKKESQPKSDEQKRSEVSPIEERDLLNALLENVPDYIYFKDTESRFIRTSRAHAKAFGLSDPAQVIGKSDFDFFTEDHARPAYEDEQEIIRTGEPFSKEERETWSDRPDTWVLTTKMPLRDQEGKIIGTFGISKDITERKRVEAELMREKQFLETLNQNSPAAIVILDNYENIVSCNPAFERLYGYSTEEIKSKNLDSLITTPETASEAAQYTREAMAGLVHKIGKRRRKDGLLVDVEIFGVPVLVDGERVGAYAIYHDITELMRARREAEEANRAKSEFLANMSHEIRTPMNGVMGMLELALDTQLTSEQRDYLQTSLQSAEALLSLLNDILDFSKIEAGRLELEAIDFNLRNAVEDVAYNLANRAEDKGLELACLIHPDLLADLRGDANRLRQILVNLVGNAIKFTHQGEVVIRAEPIEETETHAKIHFSVQDTGVGIPPERLAAIFERFTQADGSTTRKFGGTGLGLTISKQLVEMMGGRIGVESIPGVGSTFWFELTFEKQPDEKRGMAPLSIAPVNMSEARILCVDDNQTNRMVLTRMVEGFDCHIDAVATGAKALEALRRAHRAGDPYHIVLLDMQMPGMDGEQTANAIKSDPAVKDVKIIILTSMGKRGDASRLQALGCSGYLLKPVKQQMLYEAMVAVLGRVEDEGPALITRHTLSEQRRFDLRILLAEDNPINQKLAVVLLQKAGYSVDAVETGEQAVEKVKAENYSAVLMDVQMPEMDGFEATRHIRAFESKQPGRHTPIIAMTAHAMKGDRERCIEAGMDDYVAKPLEPRVLFNVLDRWLQKQTESQEPPLGEAQDYSFDKNNFAMDFDDGLFGEAGSPASDAEALPAPWLDPGPDVIPVDLEAALVHFDGDRDFMLEMCRDFRDHLPKRVEELLFALRGVDINLLTRQAHTLKGVALNFNADYLAKLSARLEECCRNESLTEASVLVEKIEKEAVRVGEYLSHQPQ